MGVQMSWFHHKGCNSPFSVLCDGILKLSYVTCYYPPTQRVPGDIGMGWVRASVRASVRPCVRPSPPRSQRWLDQFSWYFACYWTMVWSWCPSILFFDIIQNGRLVAIFKTHRNIFVICHHLNLRDGQTDFLEILHEIGTWYRVNAHLFWFFKKFKMAA